MKINETEDKLLWGPYYESVLSILGTTGLIIPIGDTLHENAGRTTLATVGEEQATFTYSKTPTTWDAPPHTIGPGRVPIYTFDGTDEEADSPDAAFWTRNDVPFSLGAWVNLTDATSSTILAKLDSGGDTREWEFGFDSSDKAFMALYDEDEGGNSAISVTAAAAQAEGVWVFVVTACAGVVESDMELYYDGVIEGAPVQADSGTFGESRDTNAKVMLGHSANSGTIANVFHGAMAGGPLGPFYVQAELNADQIKRLYQLGRRALGV